MSRRLWLTPNDRYRVRSTSGRVDLVRWDDAACVFRYERNERPVDMLAIAAVSPFASDGRAAITWTPYEQCFRAKFKPADTRRRWVHPYAKQLPAKVAA